MPEICHRTINDVARLIRDREISPFEVCYEPVPVIESVPVADHLEREYAGNRAAMLHFMLLSSADFSSVLHCCQYERITGTRS